MREPIAGWAASHPVVSLLHDATVTADADPEHEPPPRVGKSYARMPQVLLPAPDQIHASLQAALATRCSSLAIDGSRPLPLGSVGTLLHWSAGRRTGVAGIDARFVPSAGGLYPLELYVIARAVTGLPVALYHWNDARHSLERLPSPPQAVEAVYG